MNLGKPLPPKLRRALCRVVAAEGDRSVALRIGVGVICVARAMSGLPVSAGTTALIERALQAKGSN